MASPNPSNGHEGNNSDDAMIDAPSDLEDDHEINKVDTDDEYAFLYDDSQIPRPQGRGSDEESFIPSEPDEDIAADRQGELPEDWQPALIKPESESEEEAGVPSERVTASPSWTPHKRRAGGLDWPEDRPFKRAKGQFNREYLSLLNVDIEDAAAQYVPHDEPELPASQIGLTYWTSVEKELFFTALARLGRDDAPGIARRIRTKGEMEVRLYLKLLQDATTARKREYELEPLYPQDFPAAVEVGPQCAAALEEAGDAIASRQERHEDQDEEMRWDDDWLITPFNYRTLEKTAPSNMPSMGLFRVSRWLELSERLLMNANYPENNWQYVSDENPSIRTTALEDFYSLVVSLTKRLVAATIYVSDARVRAKQEDARIKQKRMVWPKDVEAAVLSLGLKTNSKEFWAKSARRLRIDVINDGEQSEHGGEDEDGDRMQYSRENDEGHDFMTYDEVEAALGTSKSTSRTEEEGDETDELSSISGTPSLDDLVDVDDHTPTPGQQPEVEPEESSPIDVDEAAVQAEAKELILYTAIPYALTTRTRRMVEGRIRSELRHVTYAEAVDAKASQREEKRLWNLLGRAPPEESDKVRVPERPPRRMMHTVDEMYPSANGGGWRDNIRYVNDWALHLPGKKDD